MFPILVSRHRQHRTGPGALDLIEEAVHLLRRAPAGAWLVHGVGVVPFVLALLYFWADMSRGAFADRRCLPAALGLALLFIWMRTWQAVFAVKLREQVSGRSMGLWTFHRWLRVAVIQAVVQPTGLLLLPVLFLPFFPFYQSATVVADEASGSLRATVRKSIRLARLWSGQNALIVLTLAGFGLIVFLNVLITMMAVPHLLKSLLGVESAFTLGGRAAFNTTLLTAALGLAYLALDPLLRAVQVLRCFYGESRTTGEDLRVELRSFAAVARAAVMITLALVLTLGGNLGAAEAGSGAPPAAAPAELDRALDRVLDRAEYNWRLPRERTAEAESDQGWLAALGDKLRDVGLWVRDTLSAIWDWLEKFFRPKNSLPGNSLNPLAWMTSLQALVFILLAVVVSVLAVLLLRAWQRRVRSAAVDAEVVMAVPDLRDENIGADQLPEDGWLRLAREMMARGELRLAMRAFYLASLAHLAQREWVKIEKFKSNRDYEREVRRRARAVPPVPEAFTENVTAFDRAWYGLHEVTGEGLGRFEQNFQRIKAG